MGLVAGRKLQIEIEMRVELRVGPPDKRPRTANLWDNKGLEDGGRQPGEWTLRDTGGTGNRRPFG